MKTIQQLTFLVLILIQSIGIAQENSLQSMINKYDAYYENINTEFTVLTIRNGELTSASIGNQNLNEHSVFNIASATKKMTAILILQEVEKGNLELTDSISTYLSPIKNVDGSLTIETLLRHRSGLGEYAGEFFEAMFFANNDTVYNTNFFDQIPPSNPEDVGEHNYCNTNYLLLGRILEKVTDQSYFDLLRERIFIPSGMNESYPYVSKSIENLAHPNFNGKDIYDQIDYRFFAHYAYAAGSIASTLLDMSKFYDHLYKKHTLINAKSLATLIDFDDSDYGLGMMTFNYNDILYHGHGGTNLGYSFREYYNPITEDLTVYFTNSYKIPFHKILRDEILRNEDNLIEFNSNLKEDYALNIGEYYFEEMNMEVSILKENEKLFFVAQGMKLQLVSFEENKLFAPEYGLEIEVDSNNLDKIIFKQNGMEATLKRVSI